MIEAAKEAQAIFQEAEDATGESSALKLITEAHLLNESFDQALQAANARVSLWRGLGRKGQTADALLKVASIRFSQELYDETEEATLEAKTLAHEVNDRAIEANALLLLTQLHVLRMSKEDLPRDKNAALPSPFVQAREKAYRLVNEAMDLSNKTSDQSLQASVLFWRAEVFIWTFRGQEALSSAGLAEKIFAKMGNLAGQVHTQVLMADLHLMMNQKEKAKAVAKAALELATSMLDGQDEEAACLAVLERIEGKKDAPVQVVQVVQQIMQEEGSVQQVQQFVPQARSVAVVQAPKGLDPAVARSKIKTLVMNVIADDDEDLELDNPLMEAGVDSLGSVQLVTDIGREFSMSLSPSAVFDFPTIRALTDHIVEESGA